MLIETVNFSRFCDAFISNHSTGNFSYEGKRMLFDYFDESENNVELDIVAVCCIYSENDWEYIADYYTIELSECASDEAKIEAVREFLEENTYIVGEPVTGTFLYESF